MSYPIAVLTTRPGQGSSTFAISLAWDIAARSSALLIDFDMSGGTLADALELETGGRSISNLMTRSHVEPPALMDQAVRHPRRPQLAVVPGLRGLSGPSPTRITPRFGAALSTAESDFVVLDLGCPLAYPDLESPRLAAEAIAATTRRVFVVLRDDPTLLPGSIQLLRQARVPQADLVVLRRRGSRMAKLTSDVLSAQLPGYPIWHFDWDERKGYSATYEGRVLEQAGIASTLRLPEPAAAAHQ